MERSYPPSLRTESESFLTDSVTGASFDEIGPVPENAEQLERFISKK